MKRTPTPRELREFLSYDPETGELRWRVTLSNRAPAGKVCGCPDGKGYLQVRICGRLLFVHRVAWALVHGVWPTLSIDHINGVKDDNRIANLREATLCQNLQNQRLSKRNTSGVKGVQWSKQKGKWQAKVSGNGRERHIGFFHSIDAAERAVKAVRESIHGEFARHA